MYSPAQRAVSVSATPTYLVLQRRPTPVLPQNTRFGLQLEMRAALLGLCGVRDAAAQAGVGRGRRFQQGRRDATGDPPIGVGPSGCVAYPAHCLNLAVKCRCLL